MKVFFLLAISFAIFGVAAGEIKVDQIGFGSDGKPYKFVKFTGEIAQGDAEKLADFVVKNHDWIDTINLYSPGGDLKEGIMMGEIIRAARIDTVVQPGAICASACFFMWMNGPDRVMFSDPPPNQKTGLKNPSRVGLHRPYLRSISNTEQSVSQQTKVMQTTDSYLSSRMVPRRLIDLMMSRGSNDIYWLTLADRLELGFTPPDLEELYISNCFDNRKKLYEQIGLAKSSGNYHLESILQENLAKVRSCIDDLNAKARKRAAQTGFRSILKSKY